MIDKLQKLRAEKSQKGFTIIEVMIVLAIAGLIILIVLLAVPALQRNGRNTAIKQDASAVVAGITESVSNNDGRAPTNIAGTGTVNITNTVATEAKVQASTVVATVATAPKAPTAAAPSPAIGSVSVFLGHKCTKAGVFTPGAAGDVATRAVAIYYSIESSGTTTQKCIEA